jgi:hypothetical protein
VKKDKLPYEDDSSPSNAEDTVGVREQSDEWEYSTITGQKLIEFKGLISGGYLLHLLRKPHHSLPSSPIWTGLPKKIRTNLVNQQDAQKKGWGFQVEQEWDARASTLLTFPIIALCFGIAIHLCIRFRWPASAGVTLAVASTTLVQFVNIMLGGIMKQKGLLK